MGKNKEITLWVVITLIGGRLYWESLFTRKRHVRGGETVTIWFLSELLIHYVKKIIVIYFFFKQHST